jgi:hypothetical protein
MAETRQQDVQTPHFSIPFRLGGINGGAFMNEQDTGDDIVDCIKAIIAFPIGSRHDSPEFGIPDLVFRQMSDVTVGKVRAAIELWEERAALDIDGGVNVDDALIWDLLIKAGVSPHD